MEKVYQEAKMSTDKTIEINCPECDELCIGVIETACHIASAHPDTYTLKEAAVYAQNCAEDSYAKEEEFLSDYYAQRKLDKAIHADTFPNK
jgi:hypothetical protein